MLNLFQSLISVLIGFTIFTTYTFLKKKKLYTLNKIYWLLLAISIIGLFLSILNNRLIFVDINQSNLFSDIILYVAILTSVLSGILNFNK